eukprot:SAG11_NODE_18830_length_480_cov_0.947507_2_plen_49_part_01
MINKNNLLDREYNSRKDLRLGICIQLWLYQALVLYLNISALGVAPNENI